MVKDIRKIHKPDLNKSLHVSRLVTSENSPILRFADSLHLVKT